MKAERRNMENAEKGPLSTVVKCSRTRNLRTRPWLVKLDVRGKDAAQSRRRAARKGCL
jgi:hypothetical protein